MFECKYKNINECKHMRGPYININEFILYIKHYAKNINTRKIYNFIIFYDSIYRKANQAYEFLISVYFQESNVHVNSTHSRLKLSK